MCGLQVADVFSTLHALNRGAVELNPLIAPGGQFSMTRLLICKALAILACVYLVTRKSAKHPELQIRRAFLYSVFLAVISVSNWTF